MSERARRARRTRPPGSGRAAALVGAVPAETAAALRLAGWSVRGRLSADPFGAPFDDAAGYLDAGELLDDALVDCAVVDGEHPELSLLLPALRRAGLLVLLPTAAPLDVDLLRSARAVDGPAAAVALRERWTPWARTVRAAVPLAGGPLVQVTVRGWPSGPAAAAELVDLLASWCGELVAVAAAPAPLPAARLPGGEPVAWAVLAAGGATTLVSHDGPRPVVRLSFPGARLEAHRDGVRWVAGAELPLLPLPADVPALPAGGDAGLVATAAALAEAVGGGEPRLPAGRGTGAAEAPADLGDLLAAARVLAALRSSARSERLVPVS